MHKHKTYEKLNTNEWIWINGEINLNWKVYSIRGNCVAGENQRLPINMDLSTAYRYNQNMMEYYTCNYPQFQNENGKSHFQTGKAPLINAPSCQVNDWWNHPRFYESWRWWRESRRWSWDPCKRMHNW